MDMSATRPVTVMITRRVLHGRAQEFERLMAGMQAAAAKFPGHVGGYLMHPHENEKETYHILFAFDTETHLQGWTQGGERQLWLERIAEVTHGDEATRVLTGLETWFALPTARTKTPPPRWKMAIVTWIGIFPLVFLLSKTVGTLLPPTVPVPIVLLIVTGLAVAAMTWLVMPTLARLLAGWLYPMAITNPAKTPGTGKSSQQTRTNHE